VRESLTLLERVVLEALAETEMGQEPVASPPFNRPVIWLSQNPLSLSSLATGSRRILWSTVSSPQLEILVHRVPGLVIQTEQPLQLQLQSAARRE